MYLTYAEYQAYGGTLDATKFADLEFGAEALINYMTFNRLATDTTFPEAVKRLVKYLVDLAKKKEDAMSLGCNTSSSAGAVIVSQSNDGVSTTYGGISSEELYALCKKEALDTANMYLQGVKNQAGRLLLYRGLYRGE